MDNLALTDKEIHETIDVAEGEDPYIGEEYEPSNELPSVLEIRKLEEIARLKEIWKRKQTKWDKENPEIKEAIIRCAIENKGYDRTIVPKATMHRWAKQFRETKAYAEAVK
ncbi:hypothetical protein BDB00DRAFT_879257 [Zychaea mexicana]|uniref:uncharacterized protein n=1 Tax=Zychaea mexicana TaxID=64656 RepID=UPI0022FE63E6|nr:uncharacterized protein BDB00DRAFT_879257 [Zychaea mexicana]KAI9479579.1 hypothetical protein BDB00DRAFT_879257 [Zychaea mexicana]